MQSLADVAPVRATKKSHCDITKPHFHSSETPVSLGSLSPFHVVKSPVSSSCFDRFVIRSLAGDALAAPAGGVIARWADTFADDAGRAS